MKDINAEAVLKLQAGFRPYYAKDIYANEKSFLECLLEAIDLHVSGICSELGIMRVDLKDWENALFQEIRHLLEHAEDKEPARPTTGNIDFVAAREAFKRVQRHVVITRVDKAANCLCVMCKACYKRVAMAELNGPAYERVEGESSERYSSCR